MAGANQNPDRKVRWATRACSFGLVIAALSLAMLRGEETQVAEYDLKAAFLLNFTKYVEWPAESFADTRAPFRICVLGDDPFGDSLDKIVRGEAINGRKLVVQRLRHAPEQKTCQVLFVKRSSSETPKALAELGPGVLTVGEGAEFLRNGGVIAFVIDNRRVRFDISQKAANSEVLTISSRLLRVARSVEK